MVGSGPARRCGAMSGWVRQGCNHPCVQGAVWRGTIGQSQVGRGAVWSGVIWQGAIILSVRGADCAGRGPSRQCRMEQCTVRYGKDAIILQGAAQRGNARLGLARCRLAGWGVAWQGAIILQGTALLEYGAARSVCVMRSRAM